MKDIEKLVAKLRNLGHRVETVDYSLGGLPEDLDMDVHPHSQDVHLRLQLNEFVVTSIGLIIQKRKNNTSRILNKILYWFSQKK